jgi:hypothetical protein
MNMVSAMMILINALASLILSAATVALTMGVAFLLYLGLYFLGVPLRGEPVAAVLALGLGVAVRLCRGSTPLEEIKRALGYPGQCAPAAPIRRQYPAPQVHR